MSGFDAIKIGWKDQEFTVPPERCMGLLAAIEEQLAPAGQGNVIEILSQPHKHHMTRLARAYAVALRYAGAPVSDESVYLSLAKQVSVGGIEGYAALRALSDGLLTMFFPEWSQEELGNEDGAATEPETTPAPTKTSSSAA